MKTFVVLIVTMFFFFSCEQKRPKIDTSIFMEMIPLRKPDSLAKMLPAEIMSYKPFASPKASELNDAHKTDSINGMVSMADLLSKDSAGMIKRHWTSATQNYVFKNDTIKVELIDFKETPSYFYIYSSLWKDSEGDLEDTIHKVEYASYGRHVDAWIVYDKKFKNTMAYISSRNRYYMTYECKGNHIQFMKEAASRFDYSNF